MFGEAGGVGEQMNAGLQPPGVAGEIAAQHLDVVQHDAGMAEQALARRGERDAAPAALEQARLPSACSETLDPRAGGRQRQIGAGGAMGDAARLRHRDKQPEVNQVEPHGFFPSIACLRHS